MRRASVAALYDVHGNLPALEAVLVEVNARGVDQIVVGGDVLPGPMPLACLEALAALDRPVRWVSGNGEREVLAARAGEPTSAPDEIVEVLRWNGTQLNEEWARMVADWPATVTTQVDGLGRVLFCHATPTSDSEIFTVRTPDDRVEALLGSVDADVVVCGHVHMPFDRRVGRLRVVNAGSVGMPFGDPGAYWLLLDSGRIELVHTEYDLDDAADRVRATDYPQAGDFADGNILAPPSEANMLRALDGAS